MAETSTANCVNRCLSKIQMSMICTCTCSIVIPTSPVAMSMRWSTICATFPDRPTLNVCATHFSLSVTAIAIPAMVME